jgi:hypothetical protein
MQADSPVLRILQPSQSFAAAALYDFGIEIAYLSLFHLAPSGLDVSAQFAERSIFAIKRAALVGHFNADVDPAPLLGRLDHFDITFQ